MSIVRRIWNWLRLPVWKPKSDQGEKEDPAAKGSQAPAGGGKVTLTSGTATATAELPVGGGGAKVTDSGQSEGEGDGESSGLGSGILKVAGAAAAGITATGFAVLVGAAVFWIRFDELHLPVTQALSVMPRSELLVQGAQESIIFVTIALLAVLIVYFTDEKGEVTGFTLLVLGFLALGAIGYLFSTSLKPWVGVCLAVLAIVLILGCGRIGRRSGSTFWPLALAVFVAALGYSAAVSILVVQQQKFAQAVAILRGPEDRGLTGVYVAGTSEKVYFGQTDTIGGGAATGGEGGLFQVKLGDETTYAVGPLESQADAARRADALLSQLMEERKLNPGGPTATTQEAEKPSTEAPGAEEPSTDAGGSDKGKESGPTTDGGGAGQQPPASTTPGLLEAFTGEVKVHRKVEGDPICLIRYTEFGAGKTVGPWWTSCEESKGLKTMLEVREALALPGRFQAAYDMRVKLEVAMGAPLVYLEGDTAGQCEHLQKSYCGHRYPGGGLQYYLFDPQVAFANAVDKAEIRCTKAAPDESSDWEPCSD